MTLKGTSWAIPLVAMLLIGSVALGSLIAQSPVLGLGASIAVPVACLLLILNNATALRRAAYAVCVLSIAYPAFLPRPTDARLSPVHGGTFDVRAQIHLLVVLALIGATSWLWLLARPSIRRNAVPPLTVLIPYTVLVLTSLLFTPSIEFAGFATAKLLGGVLLVAALILIITTAQQLRNLINAMLLGMAVLLFIYWLDIARGATVIDPTDQRAYVSWLHPNLASLLAFTFAAMMAVRFFTEGTWHSARAAGAFAILGAMMGAIAGGKSALGGAAVAMLFAVLLVFPRRTWHHKAGRSVLAITVLIMGVSFVISANVGIVANIQAYGDNNVMSLSNLTGRLPLWSVVYQEALESPLIGHGYMSTFATGFDNGQFWTAEQAHNSFLQTFYDLGIIGVILVVALYVSAWRVVLRQVRTLPTSDPRWVLSAELLAALTVLTVVSFTEDIIGGVFEIRTMVFLLVVFAIHQIERLPTRERAQGA